MNKKMKETIIQDIEQQRLREILGKPENGHLSCADLVYCIALSIKVFISFVVSKKMLTELSQVNIHSSSD